MMDLKGNGIVFFSETAEKIGKKLRSSKNRECDRTIRSLIFLVYFPAQVIQFSEDVLGILQNGLSIFIQNYVFSYMIE